jgi:hypothetical protein
MSNMSYCRFQNTLEDLQDCYDNWTELDHKDDDDDDISDLSRNDSREMRARERLLALCEDIVQDFSDRDLE